MNRLPAELADGVVQVLGVRRPVAGAAPRSGRIVALVRPESLVVTADPAGHARVVTRTFSGASTRMLVALPDGVEVRVDIASATSGHLVPGTAVTVMLTRWGSSGYPDLPKPELVTLSGRLA